MNMCMHTPGPWTVHLHRYPNGKLTGRPYIYAPNGVDGFRHVAELCTEPQELEDNARLIATAPDLLKALQSCAAFLRAWSKEPHVNIETCQRALAAQAEWCETVIAKTEGK